MFINATSILAGHRVHIACHFSHKPQGKWGHNMSRARRASLMENRGDGMYHERAHLYQLSFVCVFLDK